MSTDAEGVDVIPVGSEQSEPREKEFSAAEAAVAEEDGRLEDGGGAGGVGGAAEELEGAGGGGDEGACDVCGEGRGGRGGGGPG